MAKTESLKLPNKVIKSDWKDDIDDDIDFIIYDKESKYVSPTKISKESIKRIKARNLKLGQTAIFGKNQLAA